MITLSETHTHLDVVGLRVRLAILLTLAILVAEIVGGLVSNSLALLSDAGHVFTDVLALFLTWYGLRQSERPPSQQMTFGYHRIGIITALVNAVTLVVIALVIFYEAIRRFAAPPVVDSGLMAVIAIVGLVVNLLVVFMLRRDQHANLNVRSAFLHVAGDALSSLGVILAGIIIFFTNAYWVDPAVSILVGLIIAVGAWRILREGLSIVIEASPSHLDTAALVAAVHQVPGIQGVHDLHTWTIAPNMYALSCHILTDDVPVSQASAVLVRLNQLLETRFGISHSTIQVETEGCDPNALYCTLSVSGSVERSQSPPAFRR